MMEGVPRCLGRTAMQMRRDPAEGVGVLGSLRILLAPAVPEGACQGQGDKSPSSIDTWTTPLDYNKNLLLKETNPVSVSKQQRSLLKEGSVRACARVSGAERVLRGQGGAASSPAHLVLLARCWDAHLGWNRQQPPSASFSSREDQAEVPGQGCWRSTLTLPSGVGTEPPSQGAGRRNERRTHPC